MSTKLEALIEQESRASANARDAERVRRATVDALCQERLRVVAAGGKDIGLPWPIGTVLVAAQDMGYRGRNRYALCLSSHGFPVLRQLTNAGTIHKGVGGLYDFTPSAWRAAEEQAVQS